MPPLEPEQTPSAWQYTIRLGYADEFGKWVAQIVDDAERELHVCTSDTISEAVGAAAVAIMDVHDTDEPTPDKCVCGHAEGDHDDDDGRCEITGCECTTYRWTEMFEGDE